MFIILKIIGGTMKKILFVIFFISLMISCSLAQFKSELDNQNVGMPQIFKPNDNSILGIFNPENFSMKHSYSMSYNSFAGMALGVYTNSISYKFSEDLNVLADISLAHTGFGNYNKALSDQLTGLYLSRAELNYRPFDNFIIQLRYERPPYYGYGYNPFYGYSRYSRYYDDPFVGFTR
jgi:hypothetical protein